MSKLSAEQAKAWRKKQERISADLDYEHPRDDAGILGIGGPRPYYTSLPAERATEPAPEAVIAFVEHADRVRDIVRMKDAAYGGAWQQQGYMGNLARIMSKTARLQNMLWCDEAIPEAIGESVLDTLHDLMALCAFMAANIEEDNRWGKS